MTARRLRAQTTASIWLIIERDWRPARLSWRFRLRQWLAQRRK